MALHPGNQGTPGLWACAQALTVPSRRRMNFASAPEMVPSQRNLYPMCCPYLSFLRSPIGRGLTDILGRVEMEPCDWLLAKEDVSRLRGDWGGVMRAKEHMQRSWGRDGP